MRWGSPGCSAAKLVTPTQLYASRQLAPVRRNYTYHISGLPSGPRTADMTDPPLANSNPSADCPNPHPHDGTGDGRPVEPRTTSSGSKSSSSEYTAMFSIWFTSRATAALPIASMGCLTVVSGGPLPLLSTPPP